MRRPFDIDANDPNKPGYQGSLWIDPATGTITRLTLVSDLKGNPRFERSAILVEYGPVQIANKTLTCPLRSLALSAAPRSVNSTFGGSATEWLNENLFSNYHLFSSSTRIVADEAGCHTPSPTGAKTLQLNLLSTQLLEARNLRRNLGTIRAAAGGERGRRIIAGIARFCSACCKKRRCRTRRG